MPHISSTERLIHRDQVVMSKKQIALKTQHCL
jgi:hypothetical protein